MKVPKWADSGFSAKVDSWLESGESAALEFKEQLPEQSRKLAQEIAAMATSGGGVILLGVSDEGRVVGLDLPDGGKRDDYLERVQGIIDTIRPYVCPDLQYAVTEERTILVISVGEQPHPVFYVDNRPYIRDGRRSRPARPEEVVERVWKHESSDHKREMERISRRQADSIVDSSKRRSDVADQRM